MFMKTDGTTAVFEPNNRNICQTGWRHAWLILLFALQVLVYPVLRYIFKSRNSEF